VPDRQVEKKHLRECLIAVGMDATLLASCQDDTLLLTNNYLSSLQVVMLAERFESEYGLDFSQIGFDPFWFDGIDAMAAFLCEHATGLSG
jgi:hypothetical protein